MRNNGTVGGKVNIPYKETASYRGLETDTARVTVDNTAKPVLDDVNGWLKGFIYFADNQYIYLPVPDSTTVENHIGLDIYALYWEQVEEE